MGNVNHILLGSVVKRDVRMMQERMENVIDIASVNAMKTDARMKHHQWMGNVIGIATVNAMKRDVPTLLYV
jgi:hypothetical protein